MKTLCPLVICIISLIKYIAVLKSRLALLSLLFLLCTQIILAETNPTITPSHNTYLGPSNCDIEVIIPTVLQLCEEGNFELCGNYSTPHSDVEYIWYEDGDPTNYDLCETIYLDETTTFSLLVMATLYDNLIQNGDFENGDDGSFTSDYLEGMANCTHPNGYLGCPGYYSIITNPNDGNITFDNCGDFTSGSGNMMVVTTELNQYENNIWCQDICVEPDGSYLFSIWATNVTDGNPYFIFTVDGQDLGFGFGPTGNNCDWEEYQEPWQASGETSIELCLQNLSEDAYFALDGLTGFQICSEEEEFVVTVSDMEVLINQPDVLDCLNIETELSVDIFSNQPYDYIIWDTNDGVLDGYDGETVTASSAGTYMVIVTDINGCEFFDEVVVEENIIIPDLSILSSNNLDCNNPTAILSPTSNALTPSYTWYNINGDSLSTSNQVTIDTGGTIILMVLDELSGCENFDTITVLENTMTPTFDLIASNNLTCNLTTAQLSTTQPYDTVTWSSNINLPIVIINDTITIDYAGEFYATVTNQNGCLHTDTITITGTTPSFSYAPNYNSIINCSTPISDVTIDFDANLFNINWTGSAAIFGSNSTVQLTQDGTYSYELTDNNGCTKQDSITITADFSDPEVFAAATMITCTEPEAVITLSEPPNAALISEVIWTLPDGNTYTGNETTTSTLPGWINYTVIANSNGCTVSDSVLVEAALGFPSAIIQGEELTCIKPEVELTVEVSNDVVSYLWIQPDGSQNTTATIQANIGGNYELVVTNSEGCSSTAEYIQRTDFDAPILGPLPDLTLTCDLPVVQPFPNNSSAPFANVEWTSPSFSSDQLDVLLTEPGNYDLRVTGTNGCTAMASLTVSIDTLSPEFSIAAPDLLDCQNNSFTTQVTLPLTYQEVIWESPSGITYNEEDILIEEDGTYQLTVIGTNGCSKTQKYVVEKDVDFPEFDAAANPINCLVQTSEIHPQSSNPNLNYSYYNATTGDPLGAGDSLIIQESFFIRIEAVDNNGCITNKTINIPQDTIPIAFTVDADQLGCQIDGVTLDLISDTLITSVSIFNQAGDLLGDESTFLENAGIYEVIVTGENGCPQNKMIALTTDTTTIVFSLESEILDCNKLSVPISVVTTDNFESATLTNTADEILDELSTETIFENISEPGFYTVIVTNTNGCTSSESIEVIINDALINFDLDAELLTCSNPTTILEILTNDNYIDGVVTQIETGLTYSAIDILTFSEAGEYEVELTGTNGCKSTDTIKILAAIEVPIIDQLVTTTLSCDGEGALSDFSISGGMPPYSLSLNGSAYEPIADGYAIIGWGPQQLSIIDANGCEKDTTVTLANLTELIGFIAPEATVIQGEAYELSLELNKPLSEIKSISWLPEIGLSCYDCLTPSFIGVEETSYSILIIDIYGCETTVSLTVRFEEIIASPQVYIPNVIDLTSDNPNNIFTIFSGTTDIESIESLDIYDRWGNIVFSNANFQANDLSLGWDGYFFGEPVVPGIFVYHAILHYIDGEQETFAGDITVIR